MSYALAIVILSLAFTVARWVVVMPGMQGTRYLSVFVISSGHLAGVEAHLSQMTHCLLINFILAAVAIRLLLLLLIARVLERCGLTLAVVSPVLTTM